MSAKTFGKRIMLIIILALLGSSIISSQGSICQENMSLNSCRPALHAGGLLQWTGGGITISCWPDPLIHIEISNNPPGLPITPLGATNGIPGGQYSYSTSVVDSDGDQLTYTFDWGDGTESTTRLIDSGQAASASHSWSRAGRYEIRTAATDSKGAVSSWSAPLEITINTPPCSPSSPFGPGSIHAWVEYAYSSSASDPDGDELVYTLDWGDGNISCTNWTSSGGNASAMHSWSIAGDYRIRVIARDSLGAASDWSKNLTVSVISNSRPNKPKELFGPDFGYRGLEYTYFTMAKDIDDDTVAYCFDWGDGAISSTDMIDSGSIECAPHTWTKAGKYQINARALDSKGASSGWMELLNVTIADNDPPASPDPPSGPTSGRRMATYRYATSAKDPDGDPVKYVFDWGDETTSWTGLDYIDSGRNESVPHKWRQPGVYQVKAMALDDKGASSGWSDALIINISTD